MLVLPWPPSILRPNDKSHWRVKNPTKVKYREDCYYAALNTRRIFPHGDIVLLIKFFPPNNRWDWDGQISASKAGFDGMANAWGVNDKRFNPTIVFNKADKKNPRIEVIVKDNPQPVMRKRGSQWDLP